MMTAIRNFIFICLLIAAMPAMAAEVLDGNQLKLDDGRILRITGILAPQGREPYALDATAFLANTVKDQPTILIPDSPPRDPHGRVLGDLNINGRPLSHVLMEAGMARTYPSVGGTAELLALENAARAKKAGMWQVAYYNSRPPEQALQLINSYSIIEGTVLKVAQVKGRYFLNFGEDWKKDFTIELDKPVAETMNWEALAGQRVRVRGLVEFDFGPRIRVTNPLQLELMDMAK